MNASAWWLVALAAGASALLGQARRAPAPPAARDLHAAIHVDAAGQRVAFALGGVARLGVLALDGGGVAWHATSAPPRWPVLAPGAGQAAFYAGDHLVRLDLTTGVETVVTGDAGPQPAGADRATFSPDGAALAYVVSLGGAATTAGAASHELRVVRLADGVTTTLVESATAIEAPAFSPDGTRLAYRAGVELWTVELAAPHATRLVARPERRAGAGVAAPGPLGPPAWSPDGQRVAYAATLGACASLVVVDDVAAGRFRVPWPDVCARRPAWPEDAYRLVYLRDPEWAWQTGASVWSANSDDSWSGPIALAGGSVTTFGFDARGDLVLAGTPGDAPLAIWRHFRWRPDAPTRDPEPLLTPPGTRLRAGAVEVHQVPLTTAAALPVRMYPRQRRTLMQARGPAVLWLGREVAPWSATVRALTQLGAVVVVPARTISSEELGQVVAWLGRYPGVAAELVTVVDDAQGRCLAGQTTACAPERL